MQRMLPSAIIRGVRPQLIRCKDEGSRTWASECVVLAFAFDAVVVEERYAAFFESLFD